MRRLALWLLLALPILACRGPEPLLVVAGPREVGRFEVLARDGEILWALEAEPAHPVTRIVYGRVPAGFRQTVPAADRAPRPFELGEDLSTRTLSRAREFVHEGWADGPTTMVIVDWRMRLLEPPAGP